MNAKSTTIAVRIASAGALFIERMVAEYGVTQSVVARSMLAVATTHEAEVRARIKGALAADG